MSLRRARPVGHPTAIVSLALLGTLVLGSPAAARPQRGDAAPDRHAHRHRLRVDTARVAHGGRRRAAQSEAPAPPAQLSPGFFGVNAGELFSGPEDQWGPRLDQVAATGITTVRTDTSWSAVEPKPPVEGSHDYRWAGLDARVAALARHHLRWLPIIDYSASWAEADREGRPGFAPPADPAAFAEFAAAVAARYGPGGSFWQQDPGLPAMPVAGYEIWNEENSDHFFHGADPTLYASLYAQARAQIHAVDPAANVMVGGLVATPEALPWLDRFIAALPEGGREIDSLGWHPYFAAPVELYEALKALRGDLASHGLNPPIDITEVNSFVEVSQPALLEQIAVDVPPSACNVSGMIVFAWMQPEGQDPSLAIADHSGQLNASGRAYRAGIEAAEAGRATSSPICGPASPPPSPPRAGHRPRRRFRRGAPVPAPGCAGAKPRAALGVRSRRCRR